nr:protein ANTAGONIST OF LIKE HETEROCHROMATIN PROTEIN 1-like [Rhipicephalus microplus]
MERQRKIAALKLLIILKRRRAFMKKYWVRPTWANRAGESEFFTAMEKMKNGDESLFYTFYRMSPATFDVLHSLVKEKLTKDQCPSREPISSGERLALTLRYLSSGMLVRDAAMAFRVGIETARRIIHKTCTVLWEVLAPEYMKTPTEEEWLEIAAGFCNRWQFPNCIEAVDGKHIQINAPAMLEVLWVHLGAPGRFSDGGIFQDSPIGERLHEGKLSLPRAAMLPRSGIVCPHVFVGDEAFQLRPDFMRPLPGSRSVPAEVIYNYRLSRARRCVENAFGILVSRWRIYERQINLEPENVEAVVKATCVLHNFLSSNAASTYCPPGYADFQDIFGNVGGGAWRQVPGSTTVFGLEKPKARNCSKMASAVRQEFVKYFSEEG